MAEDTRSAKSARNLMFGVAAQLVTTLFSFILRVVLVHQIGILSVSLNGLFNEVIAMLSMAEMGVGAAIVYSLYKPLAENNQKKIIRLMNMYKSAYRTIALAIFAIGLCLLPFIQNIVTKVDVSDNYIRLVFLLFLIQTASSYLFSYKSSLLNADQKVYVVSKITTIVKIVIETINIILLFVFKNYILYLLVEILLVVTTNIVISNQVDKIYPYLKKGKEELMNVEKKMIFKNIKNIFIGNVSGKITNSTDNILISVLVSTYEVGIYTGYSTIVGALRRIIDQLDTATAGSVGNLVAEGDGKHCDEIMRKMTFINHFFGSVCACCFYCLSSTVVRILYGEEYVYNSETYKGVLILAIIAVNFYVSTLKNPLWRFMGVSGLFAKDKNISIAGSVTNLIVSVAVGIKFGTFGIFLGTLLTYVIQIVLKIRLLYRDCFHIGSARYYILFMIYTASGLVIMMLAKFVCAEIVTSNIFVGLLLKGVAALSISISLNYIFYCRTKEYEYLKDILWRILGKFAKVFAPLEKKFKVPNLLRRDNI